MLLPIHGLQQAKDYAKLMNVPFVYSSNGYLFVEYNHFTGQTTAPQEGLYYYNARWYDAQLGRFAQADTLVPSPSDPQSLNRLRSMFMKRNNSACWRGQDLSGF